MLGRKRCAQGAIVTSLPLHSPDLPTAGAPLLSQKHLLPFFPELPFIKTRISARTWLVLIEEFKRK
jgi:hypothetical protein